MISDYYDILGLPDNAPQGSITRAAQARLKEISSDASMSADEKIAASLLVKKGEETLSDAARRAQYDLDIKNWREESARPKPVVKKKEEFSYPRIGLAIAVVIGILYFSISGYLSRQERIANERAAAAAAEAKQNAEVEAARAARAAAREEELRLQAEAKRAEKERLFNERGLKTDNLSGPIKK